MLVDFDVRGQERMHLYTGGSFIMDYTLVFWPELKYNHNVLCLNIFFFLLYKALIDRLELCGLLWYFISYLDFFLQHPSTVEDPVVSKWLNVKFLQFSSDEEKLIYIWNDLRVSTFSAIYIYFFFWSNGIGSENSPYHHDVIL